jgi:hypothetical protein
MNQNINDRVRSTMQSAAASVQFVESDPNRARRRAHERATRRRRAVALGAVAASSVGMVIGVQAFSRPQPDTVRTVDQVSGSSVDATAVSPTSPATPAPAVEPSGQAALEAPAFVWKVVTPDKGAAIGASFPAGSATFPMLAVSTAPGRSEDYDGNNARVWRTDDGISWTMTDLASPFGKTLWNSTSIGSHVFAVGTAPGVAADEANPLQVAFSDGATTDWTKVDLPVNDNKYRGIPDVVAATNAMGVPIPNGILVAVTPSVWVDMTKVVGFDESRVVDANDQGFVVLEDGCDDLTMVTPSTIEGPVSTDVPASTESIRYVDPHPTTTAVEVARTTNENAAPEGFAPVGTDPVGSATVDPALVATTLVGGAPQCERVTKTWAEIGVSPEAQFALEAAMVTQFFEVRTDGSVVEIDSPVPGASLSTGWSTQGTFVDDSVEQDRRADGSQPVEHVVYAYEDGAWTSWTEPIVNWVNQPTRHGDTTSGFTWTESGTTFTTLSADGSVGTIDLTGLFPENTALEPWPATSTDGRIVAAVMSRPDPIAERGGLELTKDGVTIRRENAMSGNVFLDASTGERIPTTSITYTEVGGVAIDDGSGATRASFTSRELAAFDSIEPSEQPSRWDIVTTVDGTYFSVESIADLAGLDDADISSVPGVSSDGSQVVVTVNLNERYSDDTRKQIVLVVTPIG